MLSNHCRIQTLELCHREMFGKMVITCANPDVILPPKCDALVTPMEFPVGVKKEKRIHTLALRRTQSCSYEIHIPNPENEKRRASALMDELLVEIYNSMHNGTTDYYSTSGKSQKSVWIEAVDLHEKDATQLLSIVLCLREHIARTGSVLVRQLKRRDALRRQQQAHCDVISRTLVQRASDPVDMRFTIQPTPGESGFSQWVAAMKMVAQLPGGIPPEFRRRLWITMAERHLASRGIEWSEVEKSCFNEWSHPADAELGIQIVKDLHRTGCSLFCGEDGQENQALLKKVLLAYARWNKAVGYCQGFNMLAALILQVTDRSESDALKLMIYLIEGVLPDSYFADSLRGLSVDMAVFRELLRSKLPRLSKHLDLLQNAAKDGSRSYEPPLTNVFTMQWFLTLFCNCLPQPTVLRVWDLIFLEGNEILLRTALAIWQVLAQRILVVRTADEFYCIMGALTRELLESNLIDANTLIKAIVAIGPLTELKSLRDHYLYNITPWGTSIPHTQNKQISLHPKHSIPLDISSLKKQYVKLKQRQRQAHVIFSSAISRHPTPAVPVAMNHLLVGKRALGPAKRLGPPKGSIPPARHPVKPSTLHWKDTDKPASSSSSSDTELCDDDVQSSSDDEDVAKQTSKSQFTDNLNSSDTNLMTQTTDNTLSACKTSDDADEATTLEMPCSDKIPCSDRLSPSPVNLKLASDSEDESAEFESFLADRVKCFKEPDEKDVPLGEVSISSIPRRNSELALQIIQENSLILHRIMQCQSRLSPSPPLMFNSAAETIESRSDIGDNVLITSSLLEETLEQSCIDADVQKMENVCSWIDSQSELKEFNKSNNEIECLSDKHFETSRYHSILEKSKSLDDRYNSLFSSSNKEKQSPFLGGLHESKSEMPVGCSLDEMSDSPSTNNCSDIDFFESNISKRDSEDTLVLPSTSDDGTKDSKSNKLIQENLDLLKAFSVNKAKEQKQERSNKLIRDNVSLLSSISFDKTVLGKFSSALDDPIFFTTPIFEDGTANVTNGVFLPEFAVSIDTTEIESTNKNLAKENIENVPSKTEAPSTVDKNLNPNSKMIDFDSISDFIMHGISKKELKIDDSDGLQIDENVSTVAPNIPAIIVVNGDKKFNFDDSDIFQIDEEFQILEEKDSGISLGNSKENILNKESLKLEETDSATMSVDYSNEKELQLQATNKVSQANQEITSLKIEDKDSAISIGNEKSQCLVHLEDEFSESCLATPTSHDVQKSSSCPIERKQEINYSCDKLSKLSLDIDPTKIVVSPIYSPSSTKGSIGIKTSSPNSNQQISPSFSRDIFLEQPTKKSDCNESSSPSKSPSHVFNPFPVALNSRQSKEVPLKLGLYKK